MVWLLGFAKLRTQRLRVRRIFELLRTLDCPASKCWKGEAKMAITFEPMVKFGPNVARINIFQFHGHLKGKVYGLKSKAT